MTKSTKNRDSFIFYRSFFSATKHLKTDEKAELFDAICEFALDNNEIEIKGVSAGMFELIKPQLEANRKRFENGCKDKKKSKHEAKPKQKKANTKQNRSKTEANVNVNDNVNLNENVNLNQNENLKFYQDLCDGLKFILQEKLNKNIITTSWHEEIRKLIEIDLQVRQDARQDVEKAIQAISDHYGEHYFPIIQSAKALREKFDKIENYLARQKESRTDLSASEIMDLDLEKLDF